MQKEIEQKFSALEINEFELVAWKTHFTEREYSSLGVNMLTNGLKISDTTKIEFFQTEVLSEW